MRQLSEKLATRTQGANPLQELNQEEISVIQHEVFCYKRLRELATMAEQKSYL